MEEPNLEKIQNDINSLSSPALNQLMEAHHMSFDDTETVCGLNLGTKDGLVPPAVLAEFGKFGETLMMVDSTITIKFEYGSPSIVRRKRPEELLKALASQLYWTQREEYKKATASKS